MCQIAIISENLIFSRVLDSHLKRKVPDCSITQFSSFPVIREKLRRTGFDMIMVDGIISGLSGFEIIEYLRHRKRVSCPICFFSEVPAEYYKTKSHKNGANYHYKKPFNAMTVTSEIADCLAQSQKLEEPIHPISKTEEEKREKNHTSMSSSRRKLSERLESVISEVADCLPHS